jgi:hypothetical protein
MAILMFFLPELTATWITEGINDEPLHYLRDFTEDKTNVHKGLITSEARAK